MKKQDFEKWLRYKLYDLPQNELEQVLNYYRNAIADRMEDGMTEEQAIDALGTQEDILAACRAGIVTPTPKKRSRKGLWAALAAATVLLVANLVLPRIFSTPQSPNPPPTSNTQIGQNGIYVQSGDDRVDIGWDGIHVQSGEDRVDISWDGVLAQSANDRVDIGWDGIRIQDHKRPVTEMMPDTEPMTLHYATDHLHTLSIHEDVGNITAEPSPDDAIHITLPIAANYEQTTTDDGVLKITRTDDGVQSGHLQVQVPDGLALILETDCGNIQLSGIAPGSLDLQCDVGDISGSLAGGQSDYDIHASVDVGSCNLPTTQQTDGIPLAVRVDVGSIDLTFEEGNLT